MRVFVLTKGKMMVLGLTLFLMVSIMVLNTNHTKEVFRYAGGQKESAIHCVKRDDNKIALSFDVMGGNENMGQLVRILNKYNVTSTFFVTGAWVDQYPETVKLLSDAGHEIMNLSDTYPHMKKLSKDEMIGELTACSDKIEKITAKRPDLFRPPYGEYNNEMIETCRDEGYFMIRWDVEDDKNLSANKIMDRVVKNTESGSIILLHSDSKNTTLALAGMIEKLQAKEYKIVPVSELIYESEYQMDTQGRQIPLIIETFVLD